MEASQQVSVLSDREFATAIKPSPDKTDLDPVEVRNRERAAENLSHIFALRNSSAFDWYLREGLLPRIAESDKLLKTGGADDLAVNRERWKALAELHDWLVGLEITYRRKFDPKDVEIARLTQTLLLE